MLHEWLLQLAAHLPSYVQVTVPLHIVNVLVGQGSLIYILMQ